MSNVSELPELAGLDEVLKGAFIPVGGRLQSLQTALDEAIKRCVAVSNQVKRQSVISLELKISGEGTNSIPISAKLKVKEPEPTPTPALFYADSQGRLYSDDPNQGRLPLKLDAKKAK